MRFLVTATVLAALVFSTGCLALVFGFKCRSDGECAAGQACLSGYCTRSADGGALCGGQLVGAQGCRDCVQRMCCELGEVCGDNADCHSLRRCESECATGATACHDHCRTRNPCGIRDSAAMTVCIEGSCAQECGVASTSSSSGGCRAGRQCDTATLCGCEGASDNCVVTERASGETACVAAGSDPPGAPCSSGESCQRGADCIRGQCRATCDDAEDCGDAVRRACLVATFDTASCLRVPIDDEAFCTEPCNPGSAAGCTGGATCDIISFSDGAAVTDCYPAGSATGPNNCSSDDIYACAPGYTCLFYAGKTNSADCARWCRVDESATDCPQGICKALGNATTIDGVRWGACTTTCSPLAGCADGATCTLFRDGSGTYTDCVGVTGTANRCSTENPYGCAPGFNCVFFSDGASCHRYCRVGVPGDCSGNCNSFDEPLDHDGHEYGYCDSDS